jgi:hypothetical protein
MSTDQDYRDLLAVIRDLLNPPPAKPGDEVFRESFIAYRAAQIAAAIGPVADGEVVPRAAMHIRDMLDSPLHYDPRGGAS